jgi:hypothetical protein
VFFAQWVGNTAAEVLQVLGLGRFTPAPHVYIPLEYAAINWSGHWYLLNAQLLCGFP